MNRLGCVCGFELRRLQSFVPRSPVRHLYHRPIRKHFSVKSDGKVASSAVIERADDFLSKHGGKVALVASALAIYLFYSFYKSGTNRTELEDKLASEMPLEPYEVNEIRHANQILSVAFDKVVDEAFTRFPAGKCSYSEFQTFVVQKINVKSGHLFDRIIEAYVSRTGEEQIPLSALLIALNMAVVDKAERRISSLFRLGFYLDEGRTHEANSAKGESISMQSTERIVSELVQTCQVPFERLVIETGVRYPFRTYRAKTSVDLINAARTALKPPHVGAIMSEEEFRSLLLGAEICAWGECYKGDRY